MGIRILLLAVACFVPGAAYGQTPDQAQPAPAPAAVDPIERLIGRFEDVLQSGDRTGYASLILPAADRDAANAFADEVFVDGVRRALVRELDRTTPEGFPRGEFYRLIVELFTETAGRARIATASIDVRRQPGDGDAWAIVDGKMLSSADGLYRLRINDAEQFTARDFRVTAEDFILTLQEGSVFRIEGEDGITGLVLIGRGTMRFSPAPETERGQLRIFSGGETLSAPFDSAFIRMNPSDYQLRVDPAALTPAPINARQLKQAEDIFAREGPKSFSLDLDAYSPDLWYLLPQQGDFIAEVKTKRHGTLTYLRSGDVPEDISVFDRERRLNIALYPSAQRMAARGLAYGEDEANRYDVIDYNIQATVSPEREFIDGRVRMRVRARFGLSSLSLRLAEPLSVTSVSSEEFGRLLYLRIRNQDSVIVNLPSILIQGAELNLVIEYAGRLPSQRIDTEVVQIPPYVPLDAPIIMPEPHFLLSSQSFWYPQNMVADYATATIRVTLPPGYGVVASGELGAETDVTLRELVTMPPNGKAFVFKAADPLRYLALVVSKLVRVSESTVTLRDNDSVRIAVEANPRQQARGRTLTTTVEDIVRFYGDLIGDIPYPSTTVVLIEDELPGGHSPGYFAMLRTQLPYARLSYVNDPASFQDFPDFFLAHELAHQWWGQAVGWRNYHEQWISEGFAQYFAALYAERTRGDETFAAMLRQFRKWAVNESDQGPVSLGYRLGHIKGQGRVFRALVYNKAAAVLHMLRLLLGDEAFFNGLRRFYTAQRFQKTGTADLRQALEAESGKSLERFFDRWIYGSAVPRLKYSKVTNDQGVTIRLEQAGEQLFDLPVTVTVTYDDGRRENVVIPVTDRVIEHRIAAPGIRQVQVNRDAIAVAHIEGS